MRTRDEHLAWCKESALEYLNQGNIQDAVASMVSDIKQHPETKGTNEYLLALGMVYAMRHDFDGARRWIEGFR